LFAAAFNALLQQNRPEADLALLHLVKRAHTAKHCFGVVCEIEVTHRRLVTYLARSKIVVAGPPAEECCSINRSSLPLITYERLLLLPSQFGKVARST
jgi:hypothetical protein